VHNINPNVQITKTECTFIVIIIAACSARVRYHNDKDNPLL
jgi:hypothetical protein